MTENVYVHSVIEDKKHMTQFQRIYELQASLNELLAKLDIDYRYNMTYDQHVKVWSVVYEWYDSNREYHSEFQVSAIHCYKAMRYWYLMQISEFEARVEQGTRCLVAV